MPFRDPAAARELTELPVVYPGDADGVYRPVSDHGIVAPLDNFLGCHDLSSFPAKGIVGAACGEQAQVWEIDRRTGLPDTEGPAWAYDQPNVDFWHSATFSWDGKIANFIDESFGDGCPTKTDEDGGLGGTEKSVFETGNMYFFNTRSGKLLSEYRNSRGTNDDLGAGERLTYCSSHLGIPVPAKDRYLLVNAFYRNGSSVIDFTDPTDPKEVAFGDLEGTNTWSAYTYPRRSGRQKTLPGLLERRAEPQLRGTGQPSRLPRGRLRLHAVRGPGPGRPGRLQPPEPAAAGEGDPDEARPGPLALLEGADARQGQGPAKGARIRSARPYTK